METKHFFKTAVVLVLVHAVPVWGGLIVEDFEEVEDEFGPDLTDEPLAPRPKTPSEQEREILEELMETEWGEDWESEEELETEWDSEFFKDDFGFEGAEEEEH